MNATQDVIIRLLGNIGSRKEVEQYLRHYASVDAPKFAVVKTSGKIVDDALDALASSLTFLQRVGLVPVVVHGGAVQIDRALEAARIDVPRIRGLRPMTPAVLEVARRVLHETNVKLVEALEAMGTRTRPFTSGVFEAKAHRDEKLGLMGEVTHVRDAAIVSAARSGYLPVLTSLGETSTGQSVVIHADAAARALALVIKPHKIVYLTEDGALANADGTPRNAVNLTEDYDELVKDSRLAADSLNRLGEIKAMLDELPPTSSVSITSPENLAKELFTHRGAGTLVRRGERVGRYPSFAEIDQGRLKDLLELCFGKKLSPTYFETKNPIAIYLTDSYRAAAIVTEENGVPYLDKFAVTPEAQGEGIGGSIWKRMRRDHPKIFWRARAQNPVNDWYAQSSDGLYKTEHWWVFWCGMTDFAEIERSVKHALAMPATLKPTAPVPSEPSR
ncbi:MAG: acetylglutamate kinase [Polyangiaceae bacterium]